MTMRFHVLLPGCVHTPSVAQPWEPTMRGKDVVRVAQTADELGFDGVLAPEHLIIARSHVDRLGSHFVDSITTQAVMAGATNHVRLGSMLTILPLRHPIATAKALCTLDWLSGGRAAVTFGLGWQEDEYRALGVPWEERGRLADEYLAALLELFHNDQPSFHGKYVSFADVHFEPRPVQQPHPPIWIGGDSDGAIHRAARFGDGWAPWLTQPADIPARLDAIRSSDDYDGRPFAVFYSLASANVGARHEVVDGHTAVGKDSPQRVIDDCAALAALGVTDTWISPPFVSGLQEYLDHLAWVANAVVPALTTSEPSEPVAVLRSSRSAGAAASGLTPSSSNADNGSRSEGTHMAVAERIEDLDDESFNPSGG